jgi:hypothetical protein
MKAWKAFYTQESAALGMVSCNENTAVSRPRFVHASVKEPEACLFRDHCHVHMWLPTTGPEIIRESMGEVRSRISNFEFQPIVASQGPSRDEAEVSRCSHSVLPN